MKKFGLLKSRTFKSSAVVVSLLAAASSAHADIAADIAAAGAAGETNVGLAITAVIGIAALVMGIGVVLSLLKR
jgi:hypothetical protein